VRARSVAAAEAQRRLPPATCVPCITSKVVTLTLPERVTEIVGASTSCHGRRRGMPGLSKPSSDRVQRTPEAHLSAREPLAWIDNSPLTAGLVFHLQTPCSDLERSPLFHPHQGGGAGSRLSAARRDVSSRAVWGVRAAAPLCGRRLRAALAAVDRGGRRRAGARVGTEIASALVVHSGPRRWQVMAPHRVTSPTGVRIDAKGSSPSPSGHAVRCA
jgi:hypothetical protein